MSRPSVPPASAAPEAAAARPRRTGREVSIDWFEASVKHLSTIDLFAILERCLGSEFGRSAFEVLRDDAKAFDGRGPFGARVRADRVGQANRLGEVQPWSSVRLPGEVCRAVGTEAVLALADALTEAGEFKASRLDVALDDYDKSFSPRRFAEACVAGRLDDEHARLGEQVVTRVRADNWEWARRKGGCFWIGGRKSARLLRVYDKNRESDGVIPSTRLELQSRDEFATELVASLRAARSRPGGIVEVFMGHLVGFVDLREPQGDRSQSQAWPRVGWWEQLVGNPAAISLARREDSSVTAWVAAMVKQCAGFLVVMLRAGGVNAGRWARAAFDPGSQAAVAGVFRRLLGAGFPELSPEHRIRLEQLERLNQGRAFGNRKEEEG